MNGPMRIERPCNIGDTAYYLLDEDTLVGGMVVAIEVTDIGITYIRIKLSSGKLTVNLSTLGTRLFFDEKEALEAFNIWSNIK